MLKKMMVVLLLALCNFLIYGCGLKATSDNREILRNAKVGTPMEVLEGQLNSSVGAKLTIQHDCEVENADYVQLNSCLHNTSFKVAGDPNEYTFYLNNIFIGHGLKGDRSRLIEQYVSASVPSTPSSLEEVSYPPTTVAKAVSPAVTFEPTVLQNVERGRYALVIGNGSYASKPLLNPTRGANAVSASLRRLGFKVIQKNNVGLRQMEQAMDQFYASLSKRSVGLFYYAGHCMQVDGQNYLVPTDASIRSESDTKYGCMDAGRILGKMEDAENAISIVILDACRNNPFAGQYRSATRGLARMDAPTGSIVAYSTAPGKVAADGKGQNGVCTKHLLRHMATPGLDINDIFIRTRMGVIQETGGQQVPWESSSLTGYFYFAGQEARKEQ